MPSNNQPVSQLTGEQLSLLDEISRLETAEAVDALCVLLQGYVKESTHGRSRDA